MLHDAEILSKFCQIIMSLDNDVFGIDQLAETFYHPEVIVTRLQCR
jgi:hypothetical protein